MYRDCQGTWVQDITAMGPARLEALYLHTNSASRIAKRGIVFLDGPGALANYLKREFGTKYPGEKLALASDLAVERLSEPHYWDDPGYWLIMI